MIDELAAKDQGEGFLVEQVGILARNPAFLLDAQGAPPGPDSVDESAL